MIKLEPERKSLSLLGPYHLFATPVFDSGPETKKIITDTGRVRIPNIQRLLHRAVSFFLEEAPFSLE